MAGEKDDRDDKLSKRKQSQRQNTIRSAFFLFCVCFVFAIIFALVQYFYNFTFLPGLRLYAPEESTTSTVPAMSSNLRSVIPSTKSKSDLQSVVVNFTTAVTNQLYRRPRIAYAISITKDGSFQDGAAVLAYSIIANTPANSSYDISFIAFVHPNVTSSRPYLKNLGFHVIEVPTPIK